MTTQAQTYNQLNTTHDHVRWFRNSAPYINTHRGKTFVIMFGGEAVDHPNFSTLIHDFALLHSLGINLVLVHGARPQANANLSNAGLATDMRDGIRITTSDAMPHILEAVGYIRLQIEAQLSMGLANSPMYGARIDAVSGNFVIARPYGVRDGVDYQMTGEVRSIDVEAIKNNLLHNHIAILGPIGFSATGEIFNVLAEDVAVSAAIALKADKLIFLGDKDGISDNGRLLAEMIPNEVDRFLRDKDTADELHYFLKCAANACRNGVHRTHIISYVKDGALIEELFTRDGSGTLISHDPYEEIRRATVDDIVGLTELLEPLEKQGVLVKRGQERIEQELSFYSVIERDGMILGCAALYPLDDGLSAEVASLAIHPDYRKSSRGADLLAFLEQQARSQGLYKLFALTTHTAHWFVEHGFTEVSFSDLPPERQAKYHNGRNSKVLKKDL
ncbi:MAG: amino-acid N-acetyltransferase [Moraxella sp.]|nr:amino-acid N-acetyltransferase [Moraxella sp.]